jgi:peptidyl-prolyl cis-trans isomerase B (cyclophilin B)
MSTLARRPFRAACILALALLGATHAATAQLTPDRTYYGIGRAMPMTVKVPDGAAGGVEIQLLAVGTAEVVEKAGAAAGAVNLVEKFPMLWTTSDPRVLYAQLVVGEKKIGPAVVLQPMVTPRYSPSVDRTPAKTPLWNMTEDVWRKNRLYSGIRAYTDQHVVLETSKGEIELAMRPDVAPNTVWNFRELVRGGFYTDIVVHRVNNSGEGFVIQFGDPNGTGAGGPGSFVDLEPSTLAHDFGVISMARQGDNPNSNGSQVFLCLSRNGTSFLDTRYTSFGETIRGSEAITGIATTPVQPGPQGEPGERPVDPPMIKSAKLIDAPPYGEAKKPVKKPGSDDSAR